MFIYLFSALLPGIQTNTTTSEFRMREIPSLMKKVQQIINLRAVSLSENKINASMLEKNRRLFIC